MVAVQKGKRRFLWRCRGYPPPPADLDQKKVFQLGRNETRLKIQSLLTLFPVKISFSFLSETNLMEMSFPRTPPTPGLLGKGLQKFGGFQGLQEVDSREEGIRK